MPDFESNTREQEVVKDGICYMCTECCPTKIHVRQGRATQIDMVDERVSDTCPRWKAQLDFIYHPDRLTYPLKRIGERGAGSFMPISWDETLDTTASRLERIKAKYGASSVVFYIAYTKEPRPYFHRLTHAFGSSNYCTESSNCFSAGWLDATLTYGQDYGELSSQSTGIDPASRCKLVWGSSVEHSSPPAWKGYLLRQTPAL